MECKHTLVFNYAERGGITSKCGDCGATLAKSSEGHFLNTDAFLDMYEALTVIKRDGLTNNTRHFMDKALAKANGED